jgi:hypothetical protein
MKLPEIDHVGEIATRTGQVADWLVSLSDDPYMREAVLRIAVREFTWALYQRFDLPYELADQLGDMGMAVQAEERESRKAIT